MSNDKIIRLGSNENAVPLIDKQEDGLRQSDAAKKNELQPIEKTMETILVESLDVLELKLAEIQGQNKLSFALDNFCMHGGQELIQIFGAEKVLDAIQGLTQKKENLRITLLDVVKELTPDSKDRQKVYDQMEQMAEEFVRQKEEEDLKLAASNNEPAYKRFWDIYHGPNAAADSNTLRAKQFTISDLRSIDSLTGSLVSALGDILNKYNPLVRPISPMVGQMPPGYLDKLKEELNNPDHEDPLETLYDMRAKIDEEDAKRIQQAIKIYKKADSEIRKITLELNNELARKVNTILKDLQTALSKHAGSEAGDNLIASIAATVQKDMESFQRATDKEIESKTAKLKEIRDRASAVARPHWQ